MNTIFIRSPFYISINEVGQIGSKVELRFKELGGSYPTPADIILSKKIPSQTQLETVYNISPFAYDRIQPIDETTNPAILVEVKRFKETAPGTFTLLNTIEYLCLNGYTDFMEGANVVNGEEILLLFDQTVNIYRNGVVTIYGKINHNGTDEWFFSSSTETALLDNSDSAGVYILPLTLSTNVSTIKKNSVVIKTINAPEICEPKYPTNLVYFVNSYGGWQPLTFFKAFQENFEVSKENYSLLQNWDYNPALGIKQSFNYKKTETIRLTTGYVDENYSHVVRDLLLSPKVMLDSEPVIVKTQSLVVKNRFIDKLISYDIEFEYSWM